MTGHTVPQSCLARKPGTHGDRHFLGGTDEKDVPAASSWGQQPRIRGGTWKRREHTPADERWNSGPVYNWAM